MAKQKKAKIGILVALKEEFKTLTPHQKKNIGEHSMWLADDIFVYCTGMGPANAAAKAQELINDGFSLLISWGTAASLDEELAPGALCIPEDIITAQGKNINITNDWYRLMKKKLNIESIHFSTAPLAEADGILENSAQKQTLRQKTQAIAADMESAAIARVATQNDVPLLVVRAICDTSKMVIPTSIRLSTSKGEIKTSRFLRQLAKHPSDWGVIIRLAFAFRKARKKLIRAAHTLIPFWANQNFNK